VIVLGQTEDEAYRKTVLQSVVDCGAFIDSDLKVVFTPIHGTGGIHTVPVLTQLGLAPATVPEQDRFDPNFPTVKSPNPENAEALAMAIALAEREGADVVMATDPDCDRMGVAVRGPSGKMELLTGNQIGSLLAEYRIRKFKELGWIPKKGSPRVALIKTFVSTPLQEAIGRKHGLKVIDTLTGFKWIAEKIRLWEEEMLAKLREETGMSIDPDRSDFRIRADLLQKYSTFYAFGSEESYGYLPADFVRDKDGNAACVIFCEMAAALKKQGKSVLQFLDEVYLKYGYYLEGLGQIYYEGAAGAAKIARILATYRSHPPARIGDVEVTGFKDFGREEVFDADGKKIPAQDLYFVELANGYSYAVRGSGTEPKIKFYLFAREKSGGARGLPKVKAKTQGKLEGLRQAIEAEAAARAEA
jgi:phosphoglucomutase